MSTERPEFSDHPSIQSNNINIYLADRSRDGDVDLYSSFMLAHESLRISRIGYLQPAWNQRLSISGLLRIFMHCLTARAFHAKEMAATAEGWLSNDVPLLEEKRPHFFSSRLSDGCTLLSDTDFLLSLSDMRDNYDSLSDDDGPYHVEVFPYDDAAPERELLKPGSQREFVCDKNIDPEIEDLIVELCSGQWA